MGVLLHAHYRQLGPKGQHIVMPAPVDRATPNAPWWWDRLAAQAAGLRRAGFSAVLLPPVCKTASGAAPDADGYGLFDNYDIGSKDQYFAVPTRFGDRPRLQRVIAIMHACGLDVYADVVMHQYYGGDNGRYEYSGADGKTRNAAFQNTLLASSVHPQGFQSIPSPIPRAISRLAIWLPTSTRPRKATCSRVRLMQPTGLPARSICKVTAWTT